MQHYGLLVGVLMLVTHIVASESTDLLGNQTANASDKVRTYAVPEAVIAEDAPRWGFGWLDKWNTGIQGHQMFPVYPDFSDEGSSETYSYEQFSGEYSEGSIYSSVYESRPVYSEESKERPHKPTRRPRTTRTTPKRRTTPKGHPGGGHSDLSSSSSSSEEGGQGPRRTTTRRPRTTRTTPKRRTTPKGHPGGGHSDLSSSSSEEGGQGPRRTTTRRPRTTRTTPKRRTTPKGHPGGGHSDLSSSSSSSEEGGQGPRRTTTRRTTTRRPRTTRTTPKRRTTPKGHPGGGHSDLSSSSSSSEEGGQGPRRTTTRRTTTRRTTTGRPRTTRTTPKRRTTPKGHPGGGHSDLSSSSSSSEEGGQGPRRTTTGRPRTTRTTPKRRTTPKGHPGGGHSDLSSSSSSSEEGGQGPRRTTTGRPRTTRTTPIRRTTPKKQPGGGHPDMSSSSSSEESIEGPQKTTERRRTVTPPPPKPPMEVCVKHPPIWHRRGQNPLSLPIENSRDDGDRCSVSRERCRCPDYPFRSYDGSCNNLKHPDSGVAGIPLTRVVAARYCDGKRTPRRSVKDHLPLPSAHEISSKLFCSKRRLHPNLSQLTVIFMMFVAHDIVELKRSERSEGEDAYQCCMPNGGLVPPEYLHRACLPIEISEKDSFFSRFKQRCLHYERRGTERCTSDFHRPINQINTKTSYLDMSPVYGNSEDECNKLRAFRKGHLKTKLLPHSDHSHRRRHFLPNVADAREKCGAQDKDDTCYLSGNSLVNKIVTMAALQTLFVRMHNNIADELFELNNHWNDDQVFQQARRILIAIYQHLVYNHWLHWCLGKETQRRLELPFYQLSDSYNPTIRVGAMNDLVAAGFTMTNSLLPGKIRFMNEDRHDEKYVDMIASVDDPSIIEKDCNWDAAIRGLTAQPCHAFDRHFKKEFRELELATGHGRRMGLDLVAIDVQSGRDLGISTYNDARVYCGKKRAKSFKEFRDTMGSRLASLLPKVYASAEDVDLIVGIAYEQPYDGGLFGRIGSCIFGEQFARLRYGDRFFANAAGCKHSFTEAQLESILAVSFSTLVCKTSDNITSIQPDAFSQISAGNPLQPCNKIAVLNLKPWFKAKLPHHECKPH